MNSQRRQRDLRLACAVAHALAVVFLAVLSTGCRHESDSRGAFGASQVVVIEARTQPVVEEIHLVGSISPDEFVEIKAETDGIVQEISFAEGQQVEAGQLLVRLDETRLKAAVAQAEANFKLSQANFARNKQLFSDQLISQQEYDQAAALFDANQATLEITRRQLKDARVDAPFAGITGARNISPGQVISRNTVLTWLVDLDPVKVEVNVPERFLSRAAVGQTVEFTVAAFPEEMFQGEIYFIAPQLDLDTRTALVKTRVPNPDLKLRSGMVANLDLQLTVREKAIVIPEAALLSSGDQFFVFVVGEDSMAQMRPVQVGERLARWTEIRSGIQAGERVVVEGHQKIGPGMPVTLAPPEKAAPYLEDDNPPQSSAGI